MRDEKFERPEPEQAVGCAEPGEEGLFAVLTLVGLFFTCQSFLLVRAYPGAENCGSVPLIASLLITGLSFAEVLTLRKQRKTAPAVSYSARASAVLSHLFCRELAGILTLILLYCLGLFFGLGFMVMTPLFLFISMCFLQKGGYKKNLLWTVSIMIFIILVFQKLFNIILP